ncbi:hypothetical protein CR513_07118, partial [Mucuna pruriens]
MPIEIPPLRQSQRVNLITMIFFTFLKGLEFNVGSMLDPDNYSEAISIVMSNKWELVEASNGSKPFRCKWLFKTKRNCKENLERFKARLVVKWYTQNKGIDYKETFSPISSKDSFRIIMTLVAHYDLELHQMGVKITSLNGDLYEEIYMQWYLKFDEIITSMGFVENKVYQCIYPKVCKNDILLASNNFELLVETKNMLFMSFGMKDLGEASFVLSIEIYLDRLHKLGFIPKGLS